MPKFSIVLLASALFGCAANGSAANFPSGNVKSWLAYSVIIGDHVVRFAIPPGINDDFLDSPVPQAINLEQPGLFDETGEGPRLLSRHWSYKKSRFDSAPGILTAYIGLKSSKIILRDMSDLQAAVIEHERLRRIKDDSGPPDHLSFEQVRLNAGDALLIYHQISPPTFAVPLDAHHFLLIYINGNDVSEPEWREDARAAAKAILDSIRIDPINQTKAK